MFHRCLLIVATGAFAAAGCGDSGPKFKSNCVAQDLGRSDDPGATERRRQRHPSRRPQDHPGGPAPHHRRLPAAAARPAAGQRPLRRRHRRRLRRRAPAHRRHPGDRRQRRHRLQRRLSALERRRQVAGAVLRPGARPADGASSTSPTARTIRCTAASPISRSTTTSSRSSTSPARRRSSRGRPRSTSCSSAPRSRRRDCRRGWRCPPTATRSTSPASSTARSPSSTCAAGPTQYTEIGRTHAARHRSLRRRARRGCAHRVRLAVGRLVRRRSGTSRTACVPVDVTDPHGAVAGGDAHPHRQVARAGHRRRWQGLRRRRRRRFASSAIDRRSRMAAITSTAFDATGPARLVAQRARRRPARMTASTWPTPARTRCRRSPCRR